MISSLMDEFTAIALQYLDVYKLDSLKINRKECGCDSFVQIHHKDEGKLGVN